jgi:hypothetical protein
MSRSGFFSINDAVIFVICNWLACDALSLFIAISIFYPIYKAFRCCDEGVVEGRKEEVESRKISYNSSLRHGNHRLKMNEGRPMEVSLKAEM